MIYFEVDIEDKNNDANGNYICSSVRNAFKTVKQHCTVYGYNMEDLEVFHDDWTENPLKLPLDIHDAIERDNLDFCAVYHKEVSSMELSFNIFRRNTDSHLILD